MNKVWLLIFFAIPVFAMEEDDIQNLQGAAYQGNIKEVKALVEKNPSLAKAKDYLGRTPLFSALANYPSDKYAPVDNKYTKVISYLLNHGASINSRDRDGNTPLHNAISRGKSELVKILLVEGADSSLKNNKGQTALEFAQESIKPKTEHGYYSWSTPEQIEAVNRALTTLKDFMSTAQTSFPGVIKLNDDLYVAKAKNGYYLAMERIGKDNIREWEEFAGKQVSGGRMNLKYLPNLDGSQHFRLVLEEYYTEKITPNNNLWVVYASSIPVIKKARLYDENFTVEMYMTAITSPQALLTSHMGISRTWENALQLQQKPPQATKHPYQSIDLHSFAAKVMKSQGPQKEYMLTAPATAMRNILIKRMPPDTVFVGDNLYAARIEAAVKDPVILLGERSLLKEKDETSHELEARLIEEAAESYKFLKIDEKAALLKTHPPRITRIIDGAKEMFIIKGTPGKPPIAFDQDTTIYQWLFTRAYRPMGIHLPYVLINLDALAQVGELAK